jgi:hypothetical protein
MDFVPGETLEKLLPSLTADEKVKIAGLFKDAMDELRQLPDPGYLGSVSGEACTHGIVGSR